jgi:pimeloyl-ACP methyl ester carboxylesterase
MLFVFPARLHSSVYDMLKNQFSKSVSTFFVGVFKQKNFSEYHFFPDSVRYQQRFVRAGDHDINTIIIEPADPQFASKPPLVLMAGWGGSVGFWMRNLNELAAQQRVIAIDVLGTGRSSRPRFTPRGPAETEEWFIKSLEQWRQEMNIDQMNLCGHSLGGYIAATYAMRFPHRLSGLVLASPAGVPAVAPELMEQAREARINGGFWSKNLYKFAEWVCCGFS